MDPMGLAFSNYPSETKPCENKSLKEDIELDRIKFKSSGCNISQWFSFELDVFLFKNPETGYELQKYVRITSPGDSI